MPTLACLTLAGALSAAAAPPPAAPGTAASGPRAPASASLPVTLLDRSLKPRRAELVSISGSAADARLVITEDGKPVTLAAGSDVLAVAPEWWIVDDHGEDRRPAAPPSAAPAPSDGPAREAAVVLTDGQRLPGAVAPEPDTDAAHADDQVLHWSAPRLGAIALPLDHIRRIELAPSDFLPSITPAVDTVVLRNGDQVTGYVDGIAAAITLSPAARAKPGEAKPAPVKIPIEQAAVIELSNPAETPAGPRAWLAGGAAVRLDSLALDVAASTLSLGVHTAGPAASPVEPADLRALAFDAGSMAPLAGLKLSSWGAVAGRRIAEPPYREPIGDAPGRPSPLDADDIELPGPMFAEWTLPAPGAPGSAGPAGKPGPARLGGWAVLDPGARTWGDCRLIISLVEPGPGGPGRELARYHLTSGEPSATINVPIPAAQGPGARLRFTLEPGDRGPVQDRVILKRVLIAREP